MLAAAAIAACALLLTPPFSESAAANACQRYGDARPNSVAPKKVRRAVVCLLNRERAEHGRSRLTANTRLRDAAMRHSNYMENHHCFSHQCSGEPALDVRLRITDYLHGGLTSWMYGENIGWGSRSSGTARRMVNAWMQSPDHRANILNGTFREIGVGVVWGTPSDPRARGGIYTTDFGYRRG